MPKSCIWFFLLPIWLVSANLLHSEIHQVTFPQLSFSDTRLDNGLRVIIVPDHSAPVCAISVTYNVGSRNERPGRTGFAHLFEHMMFQGSQNVGKGEHFILITNNGGELNGTTNEDRTNYFESLPMNQLDLGLFLESDRMKSLAVNQTNLSNQRNAVQEERRLGIDNQPYGRSYLEIDNLAYDSFAYKHSVIGEMRDLDAATVNDVKDFFRVYYAPDNAVVVIVGDVEVSTALAKVKQYFEAIQSQPAPPPVDITEPEHYGERREVIRDPLARLPMVLIAYRVPAGNTTDNYALHVLGDILGSGKSSRLYQRLVKEKELAADISVQTEARRGPSSIYLESTPRPGVKPKELETAIYRELALVQQQGVLEAEIRKVRRQFLQVQIKRRQSDLEVANRIGQYTIYFNDPSLINTIYDKYTAITADQVKQAAAKYLVKTGRTVVTTVPEVNTAGAKEPTN